MSPDSRVLFAFAHDLRTHLRTVMTRVQLVQRGGGEKLPEEDRAMLDEAVAAAGEIQGLLSAMVAYSEAGDPEAATAESKMRLPLLLRGVVMERKAVLTAARAEIEVVNEVDREVPGTLQRVVKELLTNACKFRDVSRPLRIRVETRVGGGTLEIAVSDNGIGIGQEFTEKIFMPFQRLNGRDAYPGYGLGLATSQRLIRGLSGEMSAEAGVPVGVTVRVSIPAGT